MFAGDLLRDRDRLHAPRARRCLPPARSPAEAELRPSGRAYVAEAGLPDPRLAAPPPCGP
jgi:hypothetical protein